MAEENINDWCKARYGMDCFSLYSRYKIQLEEELKPLSRKFLMAVVKGEMKPTREEIERIVNWTPTFEYVDSCSSDGDKQSSKALLESSENVEHQQTTDTSGLRNEETDRPMMAYGLVKEQYQEKIPLSDIEDDFSDEESQPSPEPMESTSQDQRPESSQYTCSVMSEEPTMHMILHGQTEYSLSIKERKRQLKKDMKAEKKYRKKLIKLYNCKKNTSEYNVCKEKLSDLFDKNIL